MTYSEIFVNISCIYIVAHCVFILVNNGDFGTHDDDE